MNLTKQIVDGEWGTQESSQKISKFKLAKKVGVSWATIQNWYQGRYEPRSSHKDQLQDILTEISVLGVI